MEIQEISAINVPKLCCIQVTVDYPLEELGDIAAVKLTRTSSASGVVKTLVNKLVGDVSELDISFTDMEVVPNVTYVYVVYMTTGRGEVLRSGSSTAKCSFSGLCIADSTSSWRTSFGTSASKYSESYKHVRPVQYINTMSGKFPHRVSNSASNYMTGSCTGWWVPLGDTCGEPVITGYANEYRDAFISFLCNGKDKLLRTGDGKALIISVDGDVTENWNPHTELTTVTFNWTQIGEVERPKYVPNTPGWTSTDPYTSSDDYDNYEEIARNIEQALAELAAMDYVTIQDVEREVREQLEAGYNTATVAEAKQYIGIP